MEKPGRYTGGEFGRLAEKGACLQALIAFPDLYEIGMSNQALKIIYNGLNNINGVSCDRAFAPAPDFERLLRDRGLPLYGLDTGISLKSLDLLLFTLGYELGLSGILAMLDVSGIPLRAQERGEDDPLVIAGGPAVSNPLPYSAFVDAFWIGEAEAGFFDLAAELLAIKQQGGGRTAMLAKTSEHPSIWAKGKEKAIRAVDHHFADHSPLPIPRSPFPVPRSPLPIPHSPPSVYPVPSMKTVQHHGILEIMRGCPNGCRFCHAGYWYRPMRQKDHATVIREAEAFVSQGGYREISLSSLSSGDYSGIGDLVDELNRRFRSRHVSFQLPSLKVSTFSLSLLEKISQTRKSGLTFAVETPLDFWQLAINKRVAEDSVVDILKEAKKNGWRGAKFYFMIGLPVCGEWGSGLGDAADCQGAKREEEEIVNFITNVAKRTAMHFNINVGIFVPKPHTPYQWAKQIDSETAIAKLNYIRSQLKPKGHKVSVSDPLTSMLEGILSRGDDRAGDMAEEAFRAGSRLDAWQEFIDRDAWQAVIDKNAMLADEFLGTHDLGIPLPWQPVVSGVSSAYLKRELGKSDRSEMSDPCEENCHENCGACNKNVKLVYNRSESSPIPHSPFPIPHSSLPSPQSPVPDPPTKADPPIWRLLFSFSKENSAVFHGHLSLIEIFSMVMARAGLDVLYTQGFNPLAKLEIVSPLSIGISAGAEIAAVDFSRQPDPGEFVAAMNAALPEGITIGRAECYLIPSGGKKHSLSSLHWGFGYANVSGSAGEETAYVPASGEKAYREQCLAIGATVFSLRRACVLAKNIITNGGDNPPQPWASYFDVYRFLYQGSCSETEVYEQL
ncbi:MAG: TIGR03960 family B12-binding radical SAM protein [Treponema sp.]|nr:TIGR03960 family B12-binding radical SAM protein [Treponema sp.]